MLDEQTLASKFSILVAGRHGLRRVGAGNNTKSLRLEQTWHTAPLPRTWLSTVGMWGGIYPVKRILEVSGAKYNNLNQFRFAHSLHTAKSGETCESAWSVAASSYSKFKTSEIPNHHERVINISSRRGILPFELYLYVHGIEQMMAALGLGDDPLVLFEVEYTNKIAEYWDEQKFLIDRAALLTYAEDHGHGQVAASTAPVASPYSSTADNGEDD